MFNVGCSGLQVLPERAAKNSCNAFTGVALPKSKVIKYCYSWRAGETGQDRTELPGHGQGKRWEREVDTVRYAEVAQRKLLQISPLIKERTFVHWRWPFQTSPTTEKMAFSVANVKQTLLPKTPSDLPYCAERSHALPCFGHPPVILSVNFMFYHSDAVFRCVQYHSFSLNFGSL